jgi:Na+:H+ antiporter, NhaA family
MTTTSSAKLVRDVGDQDHIQGPSSAQITLVEYGDYECPHCRRVHPIIEELQKRMGTRLRYVFRHLPLSNIHPHAQLAAEAAEAAGAQGLFWEMHDRLFETQSPLTLDHILSLTEGLGIDLEKFQSDLDEKKYESLVREDFRSGIRSGANGTPTFFINGLRYDGPWDLESLLEAIEKPLGMQVRLLAQEFARIQASGGIILLIGTMLALLWANSSWAESYFHLWETSLAFVLGDFSISEHLLEWVNDGLMVIFFFVVGLEIKREITTGELSSPRKAALPIAAALGGMLIPAGFYLLFNAGGPGAEGWGVPMATDIAFTLGILVVLGNRIPLSLKVFFTALAIADDLGAVVVIAIFYSSGIAWLPLIVGAVILVALFALNRSRVYAPLPYAILGIGLWLAFLQSGIHPTIAGVLLALMIPTRSPANTEALLAQCITSLDEVELAFESPAQTNSRRQAAVQTLETITDRIQSPAQRLENDLHPWTTYLILPLFALANAGISLGGEAAGGILDPVSLGIIFGLVLGKPLGITLFAWGAVRIGLAEKPSDISWKQLFSSSWLAGIGFTMSLFITGSAFQDPAQLASAKLGILTASIIAGIAGSILLILSSPPADQTSEVELAIALTPEGSS